MTRLVVLALLAAPAAAAEPVAVDPATVDRIAADALKRWRVPGLAVAVVHADRVVVLKGYGVRRAGAAAPVTADTLFPVASCTKAFTTAALAALADDGKLGWDDPVRKHLPAFRLADPAADAAVTLRDLLAHRTGVPGHDLLWYRSPWGLDDTLRRAALLPPTAPFREEFQYSSLGYIAAGRIVAARAGVPWESFVRDRLTGPIGMTGVTFTAAKAAKAPDRATGHRRNAAGDPEPTPAWDVTEPNPAGSASATARDLAAWVRFHLAGGTFRGKRLVSAANLRETHTSQIDQGMTAEVRAIYPESVRVGYGMGWVVYDHRGERVVAHGGVIDGFRAQVTLLPDRGFGFALLNNLHDTRMNVAVGNALIDHALGLPPRDWHAHYLALEADEAAAKRARLAARDRARRADVPPSRPLAEYAGTFLHPAYGTARVTHTGGRLSWAWSNFPSPLEHWEGDTFRVAGGFLAESLVTFETDGDRVTGLRALDVGFAKK